VAVAGGARANTEILAARMTHWVENDALRVFVSQ